MKRLKYLHNYSVFLVESLHKKPNKVYHGSIYNFDEFNINHIGSGENNLGFGYGFYFTDDIFDASEYARKLDRTGKEGMLYTAIIPNDYYLLNIDVDYDEQSEYVKNCLLKIDSDDIEKIFSYEIKNYEKLSNTEYIMNIDNSFYRNCVNAFGSEDEASQFLEKLSILGNIHNEFRFKHYIIFNDNDIKIVKKKRIR